MVVAALVAGWSGGALAANATKAELCEAAKIQAAGNKAQCLAREQAKVLKGQTPNVASCESDFTTAFAKAERNAGPGVCPTEVDTEAIEEMVDACMGDIASALGGNPLPPPCPASKLPATGQRTCWNSAGAMISCEGTGQDGDIKAGGALSYTDNGDGTITDNNTGLMWEKQDDKSTDASHDKDTPYTWDQAFTIHIAALNAGSGFTGYKDWRLPNIKDLQSIVNYENGFPAVSPAFNNKCESGCTLTTCSCTGVYYWSSSTWTAAFRDKAWWVIFNGGFVEVGPKDSTASVRAVRGGL